MVLDVFINRTYRVSDYTPRLRDHTVMPDYLRRWGQLRGYKAPLDHHQA